MESRKPSLTHWLLRLLGLVLVAVVIVTQVQWQDELELKDGTSLMGDVRATSDGRFTVHTDDGTVHTKLAAEIAQGDGGAPEVTWGFRTLGGRVLRQPMSGFLVLLALLCVVVLTGWRWERLLAAIDVPMGFVRAVRLTFIGGFFNLVVPGSTGGDVVKAYYAARQTGRATRSVLSVFVDRIVGVFTLVLVAAAALLYLDLSGDGVEGLEVARVTVYALLAGGVFGLLVIASQRARRTLGLSAIIRRLPFQRVVTEVGASVRLYRGRKGILLHATAISIVNQVAIALVVWMLADALSIDGITPILCLALVPLMNLLAAIPLLPGGWGVGELAFAYFFGQVGVPATEAVGLSVLFRLSFLVVNLPGGVFWALSRQHHSRDEIAAAVEQASERVGQLDPTDPIPQSAAQTGAPTGAPEPADGPSSPESPGSSQ